MWQCWASKYELHSPHNRMTDLRDNLLSCVFMGDRNQEGKKRQKAEGEAAYAGCESLGTQSREPKVSQGK